MSKSDVQETQKKAEQQVERTNAGGHLGGMKFGQQPDAKTATTREEGGRKARPNDGRN
ncbi:hypothetical protein [Neorhizobium lilium]|uniref:hypothetical protein n=1 Tax=Neorhizobium lilium TaxID=2503024 RepID=UPI0013E2E43B|nr:hypothetical protein [Neorhizobium lilium]